MYKYLLLFVLLILSFTSSYAQSGWRWGRNNTSHSGSEGYAVATDPSGNVYGAGSGQSPNPAVFGSFSVPYSGTGPFNIQSFWVKYSSAGVPLWAAGPS